MLLELYKLKHFRLKVRHSMCHSIKKQNKNKTGGEGRIRGRKYWQNENRDENKNASFLLGSLLFSHYIYCFKYLKEEIKCSAPVIDLGFKRVLRLGYTPINPKLQHPRGYGGFVYFLCLNSGEIILIWNAFSVVGNFTFVKWKRQTNPNRGSDEK